MDGVIRGFWFGAIKVCQRRRTRNLRIPVSGWLRVSRLLFLDSRWLWPSCGHVYPDIFLNLVNASCKSEDSEHELVCWSQSVLVSKLRKVVPTVRIDRWCVHPISPASGSACSIYYTWTISVYFILHSSLDSVPILGATLVTITSSIGFLFWS